MPAGFRCGKVRDRDRLWELGVDGRTILIFTTLKQDRWAWSDACGSGQAKIKGP